MPRLYYEALARNVNLSQVYSVFKTGLHWGSTGNTRSGTRAPQNRHLMTRGLQLRAIRVLFSRCFTHFSPSFHVPSSRSPGRVSPSRFQLKLHLFPSSHPVLSFLSASFCPSFPASSPVTRPVRLPNRPLVHGKEGICISFTSLLPAFEWKDGDWESERAA